MRGNARWMTLAATTLLVACGSGATATTGPGGETTGPGATAGPGQASAAPVTAGPAATQSGGGGGSVDNPCGLLTAGEIEGVIGVVGWTSQDFPMSEDSGQCLWSSSGSVVALSLSGGESAAQLFGILTSNADDITTVAGIGDEAVFQTSTETLWFLQDGVAVSITAGTGADGYDKRKGYAEALGRLVSGRL